MFECEGMFHTPHGFVFRGGRGSTREKAERAACLGADGGDVIYLSSHEEGDERAEESGDEPLDGGQEVLGPEVVASGEDHEALRHGGRARSAEGVPPEEDLLVLVGKSDEVKVSELGEHRLLVDGPVEVLLL